jgi:WD40 repeat protein
VAIGRAGDQDIIVSGADDGTVLIWDAVTGAPVGGPLAGHDGPVRAVAIGRAGDRDIIVSGSDDRTILVRQHHPQRYKHRKAHLTQAR